MTENQEAPTVAMLNQRQWRVAFMTKKIFVPKRFCVDGVIKEKSIRVLIPMVLLEAQGEVIGPRLYRIVLCRRGGSRSYSLSAVLLPPKDKWPMLRLRPDPPARWERVESLDERGVTDWLRRRLGDDADIVLASFGS